MNGDYCTKDKCLMRDRIEKLGHKLDIAVNTLDLMRTRLWDNSCSYADSADQALKEIEDGE